MVDQRGSSLEGVEMFHFSKYRPRMSSLSVVHIQDKSSIAPPHVVLEARPNQMPQRSADPAMLNSISNKCWNLPSVLRCGATRRLVWPWLDYDDQSETVPLCEHGQIECNLPLPERAYCTRTFLLHIQALEPAFRGSVSIHRSTGVKGAHLPVLYLPLNPRIAWIKIVKYLLASVFVLHEVVSCYMCGFDDVHYALCYC